MREHTILTTLISGFSLSILSGQLYNSLQAPPAKTNVSLFFKWKSVLAHVKVRTYNYFSDKKKEKVVSEKVNEMPEAS